MDSYDSLFGVREVRQGLVGQRVRAMLMEGMEVQEVARALHIGRRRVKGFLRGFGDLLS